MLLVIWLRSVFGDRRVQHEVPIDVRPEENPTNEPEPDAIVTRGPLETYRDANPRPEDLCLVVEVADSSLGLDLGPKAGLFARAGIPEYWVLDAPKQRLIVHRSPDGDRYRTVVAYAPGESVAPLAAPEHAVAVSSLFL